MNVRELNKGHSTPNLRETSMIIMTRGFFKAFTKRYSIQKVSDYKALRDIGSIETLAFEENIACVFNTEINKKLKQSPWLHGLLSNPVFYTQTPSEEERLDRAALQAVCVASSAKTALDYLTTKEDELACVACEFESIIPERPSQPYEIVIYEGNIYIIVEEGILAQLEGKTFQLDFLRAVLKALYSLERIHNVNRGSWYRSYIEVLSTSVGL